MKRAAICFLLMLLCNFGLSFIFTMFNTNIWWVRALFSGLLYIIFFAVIWTTSKYGRTDGIKQIFNEYNLRFTKKVTKKSVFNWVTAAIIGAICIVSFLLVQTASIDLFTLAGWSNSGGDIIIKDAGQYVVFVIVLAVFPAIVEELFFRGMLLSELKKYGSGAAVLSSAILFSLYHASPAQTVYQLILGIVFAIAVIYSANLITAMIIHFVNNFIIVTISFATNNAVVTVDWSAINIATCVICAVIGAAVIFGLLRLLRGSSFKKSPLFKKSFVSWDNIGYLVCILGVGALWTASLLM